MDRRPEVPGRPGGLRPPADVAGRREERFGEAMEYFKMAHDRENYGRAYRYYRKEMIEKNIVWAVIVIAALLIIPVVIRRIKKIKAEVEEYDRRKVRS